MNKITNAFAAIAVLSATAAWAESPMPDQYPLAPQQSTPVSREQVNADLVKARADGSMRVWSTQYNPLTVARSTKTRDEVRAELFASRASGEAQAITGEDSGSAWIALQQAVPAPGATRLAGSNPVLR